MKQSILFGAVASLLALAPLSAEVDCLKLALTVKQAVANEQSKVLEIVSKEVSAAPGCACEVVKAAIEGCEAKPKTVAAIVEAAANAAPDQMRLVAQCAVAVAPDSLAEVQAVLAKLDPNHGEALDSSKSGKGGEVANADVKPAWNPLDFPGQGPVGPTPGGPGGAPLMPITPPVIINPPDVSDTNPPKNP